MFHPLLDEWQLLVTFCRFFVIFRPALAFVGRSMSIAKPRNGGFFFLPKFSFRQFDNSTLVDGAIGRSGLSKLLFELMQIK